MVSHKHLRKEFIYKMKVLICGDRNYKNVEMIRAWLSKLQDWGYTTLIEGEAKGADSIARDEARRIGLEVEPYPAQWDKYGRSAGPIRNRAMLTEGKPDLVVAFHTDIEKSKGTKNMLEISEKAGVNTILVSK